VAPDVVTGSALNHTLGVARSEPVPQPVPETAHYPNGGVKFTGFLLEGEMHGAWEWYRTDGTVMRTGEFDRGKQVGLWRTFDRSGRLVKETDFTG
jgi:antitoxin component YwqK of YwqJK toxin-antitoxin module